MPVQTFTTLDDPSATNPTTTAAGINAAGNIVGTYQVSAVNHGFVLSGGTYTAIDDPLGAKGTSAQSINDMGQIVGSYRDSASTNRSTASSIAAASSPPSTILRAQLPLRGASTTQVRSSGLSAMPAARTASSKPRCRTRRRRPAPPPT
jgi:uncharacterized membrane protein